MKSPEKDKTSVTRRDFIRKAFVALTLGLVALAPLSPFSGRRNRVPPSDLPGEDSIYHPRQDPRRDHTEPS